MNILNRLVDNHPMLEQALQKLFEQYDFDLRCAAPGIIRSFDASQQTVTVQLAIKELVYVNKLQSIPIPLLVDVPIVLPRAGNFVITSAPKDGDECLVVFADTVIDSWWKLGEEKGSPNSSKGAQDPIGIRRHDLSDGFAILGTWSQPRKITDFSSDSLEIRTLDGKNKVQIKDEEINIQVTEDSSVSLADDEINIQVAGKGTIQVKENTITLDLNGTTITIEDGKISIEGDSIELGGGTLQRLIDSRILTYYDQHVHSATPAVNPSTDFSGPPTVLLTPLIDSIATTKTEAS